MGYRTPNIDRVAKEGMMFTDYYAEQSCTAGRASFITGQYGLRTGLTKVGLPGAAVGLQKEDPTIADLLKAQGYSTAQCGRAPSQAVKFTKIRIDNATSFQNPHGTDSCEFAGVLRLHSYRNLAWKGRCASRASDGI
ncbi:Sulfatase family protein (plasmid) [Rhizobium leguminosarum]|uniref:Sulfatase family protein n=1 Tax=Rhizobium leguminosarum TaxID=384 RepID=A0A2Z4YS81_RHILE|nr:Sulfatase family protein [Rhizobium leguminosarum]